MKTKMKIYRAASSIALHRLFTVDTMVSITNTSVGWVDVIIYSVLELCSRVGGVLYVGLG